MRTDEHQFEAFLDGLEFRDVVIPSTGEVVQMPLTSKNNPSMTVAFLASRTKVLEILPLAELIPADLGDDQTIVTFSAIDYLHRNLEPYKEIIVGIPVREGIDAPAPQIADFIEDGFNGVQIFMRHLIVDTRVAEILGNELLGYNKFLSDIAFDENDTSRTVTVTEAGQEIFTLSIELPENTEGFAYERDTNSVLTYKLGKLNHLTYPLAMKLPQPQPTNAAIFFGPHPLGKILAGLDVAAPVLVRWVPDWRLYSDERNLRTTDPVSA